MIAAVIASEAKQSIAQQKEEWIASSLRSLAMTTNSHPDDRAHQARRQCARRRSTSAPARLSRRGRPGAMVPMPPITDAEGWRNWQSRHIAYSMISRESGSSASGPSFDRST